MIQRNTCSQMNNFLKNKVSLNLVIVLHIRLEFLLTKVKIRKLSENNQRLPVLKIQEPNVRSNF